MSKWEDHTLNCPKCGNKVPARIYSSVNITIDPELRESVFRGTINEFTCEYCRLKLDVENDLLYHDVARQIAVWFKPDEPLDSDYKKVQAFFRAAGASYLADAPVENTWGAFVSKIMELEDNAAEFSGTRTPEIATGSERHKNGEPNRKRNAFGLLGGLLVVGLWCYVQAAGDYGWAQSVASHKFMDGWSVAAVSDHLIEPTRPWTWFQPPVTMMWLVNMNELERTERYRIAPTIRVENSQFEFTAEEFMLILHDCEDGKVAYLDSLEELETSLGQYEWHDNLPDSPGAIAHKFVCSWDAAGIVPHPRTQIEQARSGWPSL